MSSKTYPAPRFSMAWPPPRPPLGLQHPKQKTKWLQASIELWTIRRARKSLFWQLISCRTTFIALFIYFFNSLLYFGLRALSVWLSTSCLFLVVKITWLNWKQPKYSKHKNKTFQLHLSLFLPSTVVLVFLISHSPTKSLCFFFFLHQCLSTPNLLRRLRS
jgi:hypothetical protein